MRMFLILAASASFVAAGCGTEGDHQPTPADTPSSTEPAGSGTSTTAIALTAVGACSDGDEFDWDRYGDCLPGAIVYCNDDGDWIAADDPDSDTPFEPNLSCISNNSSTDDDPETNCGDGIDNDSDGAVDCEDPDCGGLSCNDGNSCTTGEFCGGDECQGGTATEDPAPETEVGPCEVRECTFDGGWDNYPIDAGTACDDENACTTGTVCDDLGACGGGSDVPDPDPEVDVCQFRECDPETGWGTSEQPSGTPCDDENACTTGTVCDDLGACGGGSDVEDPSPGDAGICEGRVCDSGSGWGNFNLDDGTVCAAASDCSEASTCLTGVCEDGGPTVDPAPDAAGVCEVRTCAEGLGWGNTSVEDGTVCDDGFSCSTASECLDGECLSDSPDNDVCNDDDSGTVDACLPGLGLEHGGGILESSFMDEETGCINCSIAGSSDPDCTDFADELLELSDEWCEWDCYANAELADCGEGASAPPTWQVDVPAGEFPTTEETLPPSTCSNGNPVMTWSCWVNSSACGSFDLDYPEVL